MPTANSDCLEAFTTTHLDAIAQARQAREALQRIDQIRLEIAPGSIFSIQQNVTTSADAVGEVRLRRYFSSEERYPVDAIKLKRRTPWSERLFIAGLPFVGEGADVLARHFDDYASMQPLGLQTVLNVPLMQQQLCFATFNVFGTRLHWTPKELRGLRLLALAAARWVPALPGLHYQLDAASHRPSLQEG